MSIEASDRMHDTKAVEKKLPIICRCKYCGETMGEMINGRLFKNGERVVRLHKCNWGNGS